MHGARVLVLITLVACSQSELEEKAAKQAEPLSFQPSCPSDLYAGFATPQQAFETYATALNAKDYCRAANTYVPEQRANLATSAFMGLLMTAGTAEKPGYRARFFQLCVKYGLGCGSDQRLAELVAELRAGKSIQSLEPKFPVVSQRAPEDVFNDVMTTLADVDPSVIGALSTTAKELNVQADHATARGERAGRPGTPVFMSKGPRGWLLALR